MDGVLLCFIVPISYDLSGKSSKLANQAAAYYHGNHSQHVISLACLPEVFKKTFFNLNSHQRTDCHSGSSFQWIFLRKIQNIWRCILHRRCHMHLVFSDSHRFHRSFRHGQKEACFKKVDSNPNGKESERFLLIQHPEEEIWFEKIQVILKPVKNFILFFSILERQSSTLLKRPWVQIFSRLLIGNSLQDDIFWIKNLKIKIKHYCPRWQPYRVYGCGLELSVGVTVVFCSIVRTFTQTSWSDNFLLFLTDYLFADSWLTKLGPQLMK